MWSNGDQVTAHDFVFAYRRLMNPLTAAKYATILYPIKNAEKVNIGELDVTQLGVKAVNDTTLQIRNLITNGPYVLVSYTLNDRIVMKKNPHFYEADNVDIEEIHYIPFEDRSTCVRAWEAGEVHVCSDLPAQELERLKVYGNSLSIVPYLGTYYYALNTTDEFLSDPEVRKAMSMVIDREFLAEEIWPGMIPIMARKGVSKENPVTVELMYNSGENHKNTATAIADMWSEIGINITYKIRDAAAHYAHLRDLGDVQIARAGWIGDYSDPQNFLFLLESHNTGFNYSRYNNPEFDGLMVEAAEELDLEKRAQILNDAEAHIMRDTPFLPIFYYSSFTLVSPLVENWQSNVLNKNPSRPCWRLSR